MNVNAKTLIAINKYVASKEETRYYLNGVCFTGSVMVATDGHKLVVAPTGIKLEKDFIIPRSLIEKIKIGKRSEDDISVEFSGNTVTLSIDGASYRDNVVDGTFPEWRRLIPQEASGVSAQFNGSYLKQFDDMAKMADQGRVHVHHNGSSPALVTFQEGGMLGVIMPMREYAGAIPINVPRWI